MDADRPLLVVEATRRKLKISLNISPDDLGTRSNFIAPSLADIIFRNLPLALENLVKEWRLGSRITNPRGDLAVIRGRKGA